MLLGVLATLALIAQGSAVQKPAAPGSVVQDAPAQISAEQDPVTGFAPPELVAGLTDQAIAIARAHAGEARLADGTPLPAASEEDRRLFAVPAALETQTVRRGFLTGQLEYCRADGIARSFRPYMARLRASGRYSDRQLAYLGVLHGVGQEMITGAMDFRKTEACSDAAFLTGLRAAADGLEIATP